MTRPESEYLAATFFDDGDAEIVGRRTAMVTTRGPHPCALGSHEIATGSRALYESAIAEGEPGRCWCCVPCMDRRLDDEAHPTPGESK